MAKVPTVNLEYMTSGWVRIESGNALPQTYNFMTTASKYMDRVSFGDRGIEGSFAIQSDRVEAFTAYAKKANISVMWKRKNGIIRVTPETTALTRDQQRTYMRALRRSVQVVS